MVILKRKSRGFEVDLLSCSVLGLQPSLLFVFSSLLSASDSVLLARNFSRATLKFDHELHGVNTYICEAKNKHGLTRIFMTVLIPGVYRVCVLVENSLASLRRCSSVDNQTKPLLSFSEVQSRSVLLSWRVSNGRSDRFNHFIIYYRRLQNFDDTHADVHGRIHEQDYKQLLVDPRTTQFSFTFRVTCENNSSRWIRTTSLADDGSDTVFELRIPLERIYWCYSFSLLEFHYHPNIGNRAR